MTTPPQPGVLRTLLRPLRRAALLAALLALPLVTAPAVLAQDAPAAPAAAAAPAKATQDISLFGLLKDAGVTVWICVLLSVLVMGFTIEGFLKLKFTKLAPPAQLARLRELIAYGSYQEAWQYAKSQRSFLCTVVAAGLERIGRGSEAVEYALEETSAQQAVLLKTNMNYLSLIGVVAPMIGLTGTVVGMIRAFHSLGASGIGDPTALASAIGEVLVSTAAGLAVAIPGFVFFYVFKSKALTAVMLADAAIYHLFETVPYEHLAGAVVGEGAAVFEGAAAAEAQVASAAAE